VKTKNPSLSVCNNEVESVQNSDSAVLPVVPNTVYNVSISPNIQSKTTFYVTPKPIF
jgi:hypothetical protein